MQKTFLLDLDGTLYSGDTALPYAAEFISHLDKNGHRYMAITNCPSKTAAQVSQKLAGMGIGITPDRVLTCGMATARYLQDKIKTAYVLGTAALKQELTNCGIEIVHDNAEAVVVGYDTGLTYESLTQAVVLVNQGAALYATNHDNTIPFGNKRIPHTGPIAKAVEVATGKTCTYIGKPEVYMFDIAMEVLQTDRASCIMVGDRLDTDVQFAKNCGIASYWICGSNNANDIPPHLMPDMIVNCLSEIISFEPIAVCK